MSVKICMFFVSLKLCQNMFSSLWKDGCLRIAHVRPPFYCRSITKEAKIWNYAVWNHSTGQGFWKYACEGKKVTVNTLRFSVDLSLFMTTWYERPHDRGCKSVVIKCRVATTEQCTDWNAILGLGGQLGGCRIAQEDEPAPWMQVQVQPGRQRRGAGPPSWTKCQTSDFGHL